MKRLSLLLLTLLCAVLSLTAQDAVYIYKEGRLLDGFPLYRVDSIKFSHYDADSIYHPTWQMQDFYLRDTICRVALADIDSIAFRAPETKYRPGVVFIDKDTDGNGDMLAWIDSVDYDKSQLWLKKDIPFAHYPLIGSVMYLDSIQPPFDMGWMGRVVDVTPTDSTFVVSFEKITLSSVFERLVMVGGYVTTDSLDKEDAEAPLRVGPRSAAAAQMDPTTYESPSFTVSFDEVLNAARRRYNQKELKHLSLNMTYYPSVTVGYLIDVGLTHQHIAFDCDLRLKSTLHVGLKAGYDKGTKDEVGKGLNFEYVHFVKSPVQLRLPYNFFAGLSVAPFLSFEVACELSSDITTTLTIPIHVNFDSDDEDPSKNSDNTQDLPEKSNSKWFEVNNVTASLAGSVTLWGGVSLDLTFGWNSPSIASAGVNLRIGPQIKGESKIDFLNTDLGGIPDFYDMHKSSKITTSIHGDLSLFYEIPVLNLAGSHMGDRHTRPIATGFDFLKSEWYFLPQFEPLKIKKLGSRNVTIESRMQDVDVILPFKRGVEVVNDETPYPERTVGTKEDSQKRYQTFDIDISHFAGDHFTAYPYFEMFGLGIGHQASPSLEFSREMYIKISKVTPESSSADIEGETGGFVGGSFGLNICWIEKGRSADRASAIKALATIENKQVWIKYNDEGTAKQPFKVQLPNLQPETEYAFVVTLIEFIDGSGLEVKESEIMYFTTFDQYGPEWVDLGLPSGRLWRNANLGTSTPHHLGTYYMWGQTTEYNAFDFSYDQDSAPKHDLSSTKEDPARKAGKGRMPTEEDFYELISYTSSKWTTRSGVKGCLVTGNNGNSIFFPAGGMMTSTDPTLPNDCYYWTSTYTNPGAYYYTICKGYTWARDIALPNVGMLIRPVK